MIITQGPVLENDLGQTKYYFLVPEFETSKQEHWDAIRKKGKELPWKYGEAIMAGFLHIGQHYEVSPIGEDIGLPYHAVAIAQYVKTIDGKELFFSDPFGSGKYEEPTPKGGSFEA